MREPQVWMLLPFGGLLLLIAIAPVFFANWWGRHYAKVACLAALAVAGFYIFALHDGVRVAEMLGEYIRFIALIGSLFVVTGGIHISVKGGATPLANCVFLGCAAVASNFLGTTGASMLLIRPWLRMNQYRVTGHHVVFFIFIVSNVGGCLTPIADPPLYLGYLKGIPFWWVAEQCWPVWAVGVGILLCMFYTVDYRNHLRSPKPVREQLTGKGERFQLEGGLNFAFVGLILGSAFIENPPFLRESIMLAAAAGSYYTTPTRVRATNRFTLAPMREVAVLFLGIFVTMIPALDWLQTNAASLGAPSPGWYYAGSGVLSSVLDNAPTYLAFLSSLFGSVLDQDSLAQVRHLVETHATTLSMITGPHADAIRGTLAALRKYFGSELAAGKISADNIRICWLIGQPHLARLVLAISTGSVFFGANTYIGNGPNFMVKAVAEEHHVHTPTFPGYILLFTLPFMTPMLLVVWWIFFRG